MSERISRQRAAKMLEQARLHLERGAWPEAESLSRQVVEESDLKSQLPHAILGEALHGLGRVDEAVAAYRQGLEGFPKDADLLGRLGAALARAGRYPEAVESFEKAQKAKSREPAFLIPWAHALAQLGRLEEAEKLAIRAVSAGGGAEAKLVLGVIRAKRGRFEDAQKLFTEIEGNASRPELVAAAKGLRADANLLRGDAATALALWKSVRVTGQLDPDLWGHMAYAAQIRGEVALCDELIAARTAKGASAEDLLLFAEVANSRGDPGKALEALSDAERAPGKRHPAFEFERDATRGRALRLLGRRGEARALLERLAISPEAANARLGPKVLVDLGHLDAEQGDFESASVRFQAALAKDPGDPEARRGLELTRRHVAWRDDLEASAEAKVAAARAEAEALQRRFSAREGEVEALRREMEQLHSLKRKAEQQARKAEERAEELARAAQAESARARRAREESATRDAEADRRAEENLDRALGPAKLKCPAPVIEALRVAERTFQKALYTDLPAAAVAVLYTGALERALYALFTEPFGSWLKDKGRLEEFLAAAVRERRGTQVEYFDHFVAAFDEARREKAPSMGEVGRVLQKRNERHLGPFREFLRDKYAADDAFYAALSALVLWSKEKLRDPLAHGRMDEVTYDLLKKFREELLFDLGGRGRGAVAGLW